MMNHDIGAEYSFTFTKRKCADLDYGRTLIHKAQDHDHEHVLGGVGMSLTTCSTCYA